MRRGTVGDDLRRGGIRFGLHDERRRGRSQLERRIGLQLRIKMPLLFTAGGVQREQSLVVAIINKSVSPTLIGVTSAGDFARIVGLFQIRGRPTLLSVANVIQRSVLSEVSALPPDYAVHRSASSPAIDELVAAGGVARSVPLISCGSLKPARVRMPPLISSATTSAATAPPEGTTSRCQTNGNISQMPKNTVISLRGGSAQKSNPGTSHTPQIIVAAAGRHTVNSAASLTAP